MCVRLCLSLSVATVCVSRVSQCHHVACPSTAERSVISWSFYLAWNPERQGRTSVYICVHVCQTPSTDLSDILSSTTAVFSYTIGSIKLSANEQFFVGAQTVVSLLQTTQMMMSWCLMSSDVIWHIRDKLWPMPKHGSIKATYVRCMRV